MNQPSDDISGSGIDDSRKYRLISIEKVDAPAGAPEIDEWYQYVISEGPSKIEGKRSGSLQSVTEHVERFLESLNRRTVLGYSTYAARLTKK